MTTSIKNVQEMTADSRTNRAGNDFASAAGYRRKGAASGHVGMVYTEEFESDVVRLPTVLGDEVEEPSSPVLEPRCKNHSFMPSQRPDRALVCRHCGWVAIVFQGALVIAPR